MTKKNDDIFSLRELAMERSEARDNLQDHAAETKERLKPSNLVAEARSKAADRAKNAGKTAIDGMKANPGITATVAATATLIAMRKPIARLIANHKKSQPDETEE